MKKIFLGLVLLVLFALVGCGEPFSGNELQNVTRVFVHGWGDHYSVMVEDPRTKQIQHIDFGLNADLIADVKPNETMWVETLPRNNGKKYRIHIHSTNDVEGGQTGGKSPQQTNVVR